MQKNQLLLVILIFLQNPFTFSQYLKIENNNQKVGTLPYNNDLLINGKYYYEPHSNAAGHCYFFTDSWLPGWLSIQGIVFQSVDIKLDVLSDKLVVRHYDSKGVEMSIELNPELVDSFSVYDRTFVVNSYNKIDKNYLEQIYVGDLKLLKEHRKFFKKVYNNFTPYGQISKIYTNSFIYKDGEVFKVNSKGEFLNVFGENKKQIKKYMKSNKIKYKKASRFEIQQLMKFCDEL